MSNARLSRFLGGSPARVVVQLVFLSLVVGVVMSALDLSPMEIVRWIGETAQRIVDMGFGAVERVFGYLVIGAVVVVPIWLVLRLIAAGRGDGG